MSTTIGDPKESGSVVHIPLTRGLTTIVDATDKDLASHKWFASNRASGNTYACRDTKKSKRQTRHYLHRVILARKLGRDIPPGMVVDHINNNPLDNRRSNLRLATISENLSNGRRPRLKNPKMKAPYRGVYWIEEKHKWRAQISIRGKTLYLGYHNTAEDAALAYNEAAAKYRPKFSRYNVIIGQEQGL